MNSPTDSHTQEAGALPNAQYKRLPRVLGAVQHRFMERCGRILERAFLEAEDALQEASIGARGRAPLEAIEQLRKQRSAMLRGFAEGLGSKFNEILQGSAAKQAANDAAAKLHLDVVEGEAFAAFQRLKDSAAKLRRHHQASLDIANKRINHLVLQVEVNETCSPLEPASIIETFVRFADSRHLSKQAKEALIHQFEVQLGRKLGACYAEVNQVLIDARILPEPGPEAAPQTSAVPTPSVANKPAPEPKAAKAAPVKPAAPSPSGHARPVKTEAAAKASAMDKSRPRVPQKANLIAQLDESTIPVLDDKVDEAPLKKVEKPQKRVEHIRQNEPKQIKPEPRLQPARDVRAQNSATPVVPKQSVPAKAQEEPAGREILPMAGPGVSEPKPDPRQRQSPPNCVVPGRTQMPPSRVAAEPATAQKPRTVSKPSAYQLEILEFYRKRPVMSAPDLDFDEPVARPTTAFLGDNPERDKVMAMCTELFDEIRNDDEVPALVRQKLMYLRVTFTAYAVNRNPHFLTQPESPARCLLELLWDLGRAVTDSATLQYNIIFIQISEAVESLLIPSLASDRDFFREYRKILARHY